MCLFVGQHSQPVTDEAGGAGAVVEVLPVPAGQRGGGNVVAGANQPRKVSGRRQRSRHVSDAYQTTRGNCQIGCMVGLIYDVLIMRDFSIKLEF